MATTIGTYICGNCGHEFNAREMLCEDWRDPKKSMVCPNCKYYIEVPKNWKSKYAIALTIFAIVLGLVISFVKGFEGRPLTGTMIFIALPAWLWASSHHFSGIKTIAHGKSKI